MVGVFFDFPSTLFMIPAEEGRGSEEVVVGLLHETCI